MASKGIEKLVQIAETIADNKYVLGDRLVEVGISGPNIEATLSSIAMAQQELGHARLLYRWAQELQGKDSNIDVKEQTGKAFKRNIDISNWIELITSIYVSNIAINVVTKSIVDANNPNVKTPFSKMFREQVEHLIYSKSWSQKLLQDKGSIPSATKKALQDVAKEAREWLEDIEKNQSLIDEKLIVQNANLVEKFESELKDVIVDGVVPNVV